MTTEPRKRFSMIREFHFADWFTLGNAVCGTGALFSSMTYLQTGYAERIYVACGLIFAALIFDILDGRIARWRQKSSAMGRELDSLADVISFGVAPAVCWATHGRRVSGCDRVEPLVRCMEDRGLHAASLGADVFVIGLALMISRIRIPKL